MAGPHRLNYISRGVLIVATLGITPALGADPENGQRLALRWCAPCHVVEPSQIIRPTSKAPPFATIANRPDFDADKLALFLLEPHPKMPDMGLFSRIEAADLAAYIATLK
jgi:mono/diheme cytochrome c family protein